jgi:hypothetical protein
MERALTLEDNREDAAAVVAKELAPSTRMWALDGTGAGGGDHLLDAMHWIRQAVGLAASPWIAL